MICPMSGGIESEREKVARRWSPVGERGPQEVKSAICGKRAVQWSKQSLPANQMDRTHRDLLQSYSITCRSTDPDALLSAIVVL